MANDDEEIELETVARSAADGNGASKPSSCSFCGKSEAEVNCLLAGADALICDACIARYKAQLRDQV